MSTDTPQEIFPDRPKPVEPPPLPGQIWEPRRGVRFTKGEQMEIEGLWFRIHGFRPRGRMILSMVYPQPRQK